MLVNQKPTQKARIAIDQSQKEVLQNSYRTKESNFLTAFSEDNYELFPVNEETEKYIQVTSLDTLVNSCLVKRDGPKASFTKSKHNMFSTQPYQMVENSFQKATISSFGYCHAKLYIQQALGNLAEHFQSKILTELEDLIKLETFSL